MSSPDLSKLNKPVPHYERVKDNAYATPTKITVRLSDPRLGLGVFATEDIFPNEVIERTPVIQTGWRSKYIGDPMMHRMSWSDGCTCAKCAEHGNWMYLPLGYGALYNHQENHNAQMHIDFEHLVGDIIATKFIRADSEIFISYGDRYFTNRPQLKLV